LQSYSADGTTVRVADLRAKPGRTAVFIGVVQNWRWCRPRQRNFHCLTGFFWPNL